MNILNKVEEEPFFNKYLKLYNINDDFNMSEFIDDVVKASISINYIDVKESVESDMQTVSGTRYRSISDFKSEYGKIMVQGSDVTIEINSDYNFAPLVIMVNEEAKSLSTVITDSEFDIDEIIKQSKGQAETGFFR